MLPILKWNRTSCSRALSISCRWWRRMMVSVFWLRWPFKQTFSARPLRYEWGNRRWRPCPFNRLLKPMRRYLLIKLASQHFQPTRPAVAEPRAAALHSPRKGAGSSSEIERISQVWAAKSGLSHIYSMSGRNNLSRPSSSSTSSSPRR